MQMHGKAIFLIVIATVCLSYNQTGAGASTYKMVELKKPTALPAQFKMGSAVGKNLSDITITYVKPTSAKEMNEQRKQKWNQAVQKEKHDLTELQKSHEIVADWPTGVSLRNLQLAMEALNPARKWSLFETAVSKDLDTLYKQQKNEKMPDYEIITLVRKMEQENGEDVVNNIKTLIPSFFLKDIAQKYWENPYFACSIFYFLFRARVTDIDILMQNNAKKGNDPIAQLLEKYYFQLVRELETKKHEVEQSGIDRKTDFTSPQMGLPAFQKKNEVLKNAIEYQYLANYIPTHIEEVYEKKYSKTEKKHEYIYSQKVSNKKLKQDALNWYLSRLNKQLAAGGVIYYVVIGNKEKSNKPFLFINGDGTEIVEDFFVTEFGYTVERSVGEIIPHPDDLKDDVKDPVDIKKFMAGGYEQKQEPTKEELSSTSSTTTTTATPLSETETSTTSDTTVLTDNSVQEKSNPVVQEEPIISQDEKKNEETKKEEGSSFVSEQGVAKDKKDKTDLVEQENTNNDSSGIKKLESGSSVGLGGEDETPLKRASVERSETPVVTVKKNQESPGWLSTIKMQFGRLVSWARSRLGLQNSSLARLMTYYLKKRGKGSK